MPIRTLQSEVSNFLRDNRIHKRDFAKAIGISPASLSHWFQGRLRFNSEIIDVMVFVIDNYSSKR